MVIHLVSDPGLYWPMRQPSHALERASIHAIFFTILTFFFEASKNGLVHVHSVLAKARQEPCTKATKMQESKQAAHISALLNEKKKGLSQVFQTQIDM